MASWLSALSRTRQQFAQALTRLWTGGGTAGQTIAELEEQLLRADVPLRLVGELLPQLRHSAGRGGPATLAELRRLLREALGLPGDFAWAADRKPRSFLIVGVNGSGKTTTCAKLARQAAQAGCRVLLGAADTFRAAGADQLTWWAEHLHCDVVAGAPGADAAAVAYDALAAAQARGCDVVLIDTAGRMHTKAPLMRELQKVRNALAKRQPGAPEEVWLVLDATLGQNAIVQARQFHDAVPLTGAIIAKVDGSSKAGFIFAVTRELGVPIRFIGLGEGADDLAPFEAEKFVDALLGAEASVGVQP
ncbi:MAG: signal recognition particle-docking protein FtsY [Kiritimatiellaeota bacterium]|nr:signal recognition particle-docking protein FtsY [Kiritimatiellota bacterium]